MHKSPLITAPSDMFSWIVKANLKLRLLVFSVAVAMMILGAERILHMPVGVLPEFAPPKVAIQIEGDTVRPPERDLALTAINVPAAENARCVGSPCVWAD